MSLNRWPHLFHGLAFEARRLRQGGVASIAIKLLRRAASLMLWLPLLPASLAMHAAGYRRVNIFTDRIGHLCLEPDCLLKDVALGNTKDRRWFVLAPPGRVANDALLEYWTPHIRVYRGPFVRFLLESMSRFWLLRHDVSRYALSFEAMPDAYRVYSSWGNRPPLLRLSAVDEEWSRGQLAALGLPPEAWFVCLHCREGGYAPVDEELHAHRNSDVETAQLAIEAIIEHGGWVIRIGDPSMKAIAPRPGVIDYAHHPCKSARLDLVLCSKARFILGNTSGIALLGTVFGVPCATANTIPTWSLWFGTRDVSIPKLLWSNRLCRYLTFEETFADPVGRFQYAVLFQKAGIRPDENSASDLRDLAIEMLARLEGRFEQSPDDEVRSARLFEVLTRHRRGTPPPARIGTTFLRRHSALLHTPKEPSLDLTGPGCEPGGDPPTTSF